MQSVIYDDFHSKIRVDQNTMLTLTGECGNKALRHSAKIIEHSRIDTEQVRYCEQWSKFIYEIDGELYLIRIRKLTPRECWRLMGFSDSDFDKASAVNSNTQLYKQAGNSIVKNVLERLFKQFYRPQDRMATLKMKSLSLLDAI